MENTSYKVKFSGNRAELAKEVSITALLTLFTAGLYKSWMKTRLRRWYWSSVRIGDQPLEYTGLGSEKFLGFMMAVAFLAFYICVVNVILMYLSFSLVYSEHGGAIVSAIGLLPLAFYAQYRARAYLCSRTRWRGIRFALEDGAGGFVWRSLAGLAASVATLGLLLPWMVFQRERYLTDRTWYGSVNLEQGGDWRMLLPHVRYFFIGIVASVLVIALGRLADPHILYGLWGTIPIALAGFLYFRAESFRELMNRKQAGDMKIAAAPPTAKIVRTFMIGNTIVFLFWALAVAAVTNGFTQGFAGLKFSEYMDFVTNNAVQWIVLSTIFLTTAVIYLVWSILNHVFVLVPMTRLFADSVILENTELMARVAQREGEAQTGASGLFEALDMGMGI
ncbi:DUF898 family protein [Litoreibacter roseus]|uniref:DUF898 family protein n=1 Tax=Litoreibacter roseus TaxID=2601869 RepID=UPI001356D4B2|nr:DUF898 family protein [Litoreibacter roseus]